MTNQVGWPTVKIDSEVNHAAMPTSMVPRSPSRHNKAGRNARETISML